MITLDEAATVLAADLDFTGDGYACGYVLAITREDGEVVIMAVGNRDANRTLSAYNVWYFGSDIDAARADYDARRTAARRV